MKSLCSECGEEMESCICIPCNLNIQQLEYSQPDFKFEWAFESITNYNSPFRDVYPVYD